VDDLGISIILRRVYLNRPITAARRSLTSEFRAHNVSHESGVHFRARNVAYKDVDETTESTRSNFLDHFIDYVLYNLVLLLFLFLRF
jgi:hypothetical protein